MISAAAGNFTASVLLLLVVLFRAGDISEAIESPTGQPYIAILLNATQSTAGTAVMVAYIVFALIFCATNMVTTSSRQLYSFARDNGLPYSAWLAKVSPQRRIPTNAIICTACFTLILSAILAGSPLAFNIIASLGAASILGSYVVSIGTITYRRVRGFKLLKTQFSLGRFALPINILALAFVSFAWVLAFFPAAPNPTAESMNWSSLIFGVVVIGSLILYVVKKRHEYHGPVASVRRTEEVDQAIDLGDYKI
jgi:choline transport protein